ncbi:MAG: exodeoxyribonuclease VII large subunit [Lachnospiraceae bacterium]|nr:exodeoxyribonuclease VII large subunit [Lachnospiraceae bacterium]
MPNIYTVQQVNSYIKNMFAQDFMMQSVLVRGEVSNCKYHSSGHIYFTIKDRSGTIACVMFAGNRSGLAFHLEIGQQVVVGGSIEVYERSGAYQLYAKTIMPDGRGTLHERFELLKKELLERGMFAPEYKQPIPTYIHTLGVVTAPTGAAVRDIINVTRRRNPYVQIILYPAIVQGDQAAQSIVQGIRMLEHLGVDVMIVGRGGGSIEDLWAFNEEIVAQAVFDCSVPIISAVGHETDTTIIDYVSDLRAPTPSAAAELAVADIRELYDRFAGYELRLSRGMEASLTRTRLKMTGYAQALQKRSPEARLREDRHRLVLIEDALRSLIERKLTDQKLHTERIERMLPQLMDRKLRDYQHRVAMYAQQMKGVSPLEKLTQGYAYVADETGHTLQSISQVSAGSPVEIYVRDGKISAKVHKAEGMQYI